MPNFKRVLTVLEVKTYADYSGGQFAPFSRHDEWLRHPKGQGNTEEETARFNANNMGYRRIVNQMLKAVNNSIHGPGVSEDGGDVPKKDPLFRKVRYGGD